MSAEDGLSDLSSTNSGLPVLERAAMAILDNFQADAEPHQRIEWERCQLAHILEMRADARAVARVLLEHLRGKSLRIGDYLYVSTGEIDRLLKEATDA